MKNFKAFESLITNQAITKRHRDVYTILFYHGPMTGAELKKRYRETIKEYSRNSETLRNRITELKKMGLVEVVGKKICNQSQREVSTFAVTDALKPKCRYYEMSEKQKLRLAMRKILKEKDIEVIKQIAKEVI